MHRKITTILIVCLVTLGMSVSWPDASYGKCGAGKDCGQRKMACFEAPGGPIDLTEAQFTEISQLRQDEQDKLAPIRKELERLHEELRGAMESDTINEEEIRQLARQKADRKVDLKLTRKEFRVKIEALLSPEQVAKMKEHRKSQCGKHGRHGDDHGKHHGGPKCDHSKGSRY